MDAKEALRYFNFVVTLGRAYYPNSEAFKAYELAVEALEKVETLEAENARLEKYNDTLIADNNLLRKELDTQDLLSHEDDIEFAEMEHLKKENARLREKETPKKPIFDSGNRLCGECMEIIKAYEIYCPFCGQAIKNDKE